MIVSPARRPSADAVAPLGASRRPLSAARVRPVAASLNAAKILSVRGLRHYALIPCGATNMFCHGAPFLSMRCLTTIHAGFAKKHVIDGDRVYEDHRRHNDASIFAGWCFRTYSPV
jgi:hypothetical protein